MDELGSQGCLEEQGIVKAKMTRMLKDARIRSSKNRANTTEFDLDIVWLSSRMRFCEVSGAPFVFTKRYHPASPSIDRIDSSKGYIKDNCRVIMTGLNLAKKHLGDRELEEFIQLLNSVKFRDP